MRLAVEIPAVVSLALAALAGLGSSVSAQTIADYSRSQRAVLEAEIAKNTAKAMASMPAAPPAIATPAPGSGDKTPTPATRDPAVLSDIPPWTVSGVFLSPSHSVAEVVVDGVAHLLSAGQAVPGTPWRVQSVAADRVVLVPVSPSRSGKARAATAAKVLRLPVGSP
jgi:type IV pilus biogenesis protein PilP